MDRIGEYLVKRLIGEGGMGKVYEAEERLSKRRVALKVLRPELTRHEEGRRLFLNEMQILAHLEHPHLVRSLASMENEGQLVLVLEYLRGRTLRQELSCRGSLPWQEALEHVARIATALTVAHGQEPAIVHRDLKPENVMLTVGEGRADDAEPTGLKVMDFGVAKVLEGVHGTNTQSIGTLQYMSPEQIDARDIDARSDIYALGLMFYEMLSGEPPFRSPSPRELLNMQCSSPPPPFDGEVRRALPRGVEDLVFAMLAKSPSDRPASAEEVVDRLSPFRASLDVATRPSQHPSGRPARRSSSPPATPHTNTPSPSKRTPSGDTMHSVPSMPVAKAAAPRTDTIALVEKNVSAGREVPTWLALVAIVALSLVAGMTTYLVRVRSTSSWEAPAGASTSPAGDSFGARAGADRRSP